MDVQIKTLNVGQAMCSVAFAENNAVFFDSGNDDALGDLEKVFAEGKIEHCSFVISHLDDDHVGGLIELLKRYPDKPIIDEIYIPERGDGTDTENYNKLRKLIYQNEAILSTKELLKINPDEKKLFSKATDRKYKNPPKFHLVEKFKPKDDFELLYLKYLVYLQNGGGDDITAIKKLYEQKGVEIDEADIYKDIAKYAEKICSEHNVNFRSIKFDTVKPGETKVVQMYNIGLVEMMKPDYDGKYENENHNTMIAFLTANKNKLCFPGDIPAEKERNILARIMYNHKCIYMIVPHHGAKGSSTKDFILAINPNVSVVQAKKGKYGHPSETTLINFNKWGKCIINQEDVKEITVILKEDGQAYLKIEELSKIMRSKEIEKKMGKVIADIENKCIQYFCSHNEIQLIQRFSEADTMEKAVMIPDLELQRKYRDALYMCEAVDEFLTNGISIDDDTIVKMFIDKNGQIKKFENDDMQLEYVISKAYEVQEYQKYNPVK
ncbi:MAG: hypothetical protein PUC68_03590 [Firmicutes bacterium]|nr:hypothetical protein [Bacillota bacterium]